MNNLYNYFENVFNEKKLVQSYLIGNTKFDDIKDELYNVFSSFFFKNDSDLDNNPDLYVLKSDNGIISKDDIKNLLKNINTTSQFNNIKIYVIDECENLNDFAFNAILKTLEEPSPNIYAFLITKNIDSVKPTIVSRCQKIFISSEVKNMVFNNEITELGDEIITLIENENIKTISRHPEIYNKIVDRDLFKNILLYMQNKYMDKLKSEIDCDDNSSNVELLSKKILVINKNINLMSNYLNKNLSIDRFIIEIWRCTNENS